jgi:acyl carrier protein
MGRRDQRIKILGNRIELGEVERALMEFPAVEQAVVVANLDGPMATSTVGFVKSKAATGSAAGQQIQQHLQRILPRYMVPARIIAVADFPRGRTGKIDRQKLLEDLPPAQVTATPSSGKSEDGDAPLSKLEQTLQQIWCEVLGKRPEEVGIYDSFFELGGHSLLAARITKRVQARIGVKLEVRSIFEAVTIAALCDLIESQEAADSLEEVQLDR